MKDTVRIPRPVKPAAKESVPPSHPAHPSKRETVRLDRPPTKTPPPESSNGKPA